MSPVSMVVTPKSEGHDNALRSNDGDDDGLMMLIVIVITIVVAVGWNDKIAMVRL